MKKGDNMISFLHTESQASLMHCKLFNLSHLSQASRLSTASRVSTPFRPSPPEYPPRAPAAIPEKS